MKTKFKGTKGKWFIDGDKWVITDDKSEHGDIICAPPEEWELSIIKWDANALLISKAPELLSMLESIVQGFESDYVVCGEIVDSPYEWLQDRYKEAKQLIEEATNI